MHDDTRVLDIMQSVRGWVSERSALEQSWLHRAVYYQCTNVVKRLVDIGDLNTLDRENRSPLEIAIMCNNGDAFDLIY
jgi:ankyrin repeat protein